MSEYLESLCVFICVAELLGNFLPSEKFTKWYRYMAGLFVLLLIIKPLGNGVEKMLEQKEMNKEPTVDIESLEDAYLRQLEEEDLMDYLQSYGYVEK